MDKLIFWTILTSLFITLVVLFSNILAPFIVAWGLSYMLQPSIELVLLKSNFSRPVISFVIIIIVFSIFVILLSLLIPIVYQQTTLLITKIPKYNQYLQTELLPLVTEKIYKFEPNIANRIIDFFANFVNEIFAAVTIFLNNLWRYTIITISVVGFILLTPILLFYFLKDWLKMKKTLQDLLPLKYKDHIKEIGSKINDLLAGYIRGQINVCLLLTLYYCSALTLIGVDLGILLGILSGFSIIIPFIGVVMSFSITIIVSYLAFGLTYKLLYICLVYFIGAISDSYLLSPKIIGSRIGLHPLWIIFAVFALGNILGFIGILLAMPIAGIIKILLSYSVELYKQTKFYKL